MKAKGIFLAMMISVVVASCENDKKTKTITSKEDGKQYVVEDKAIQDDPRITSYCNELYYFDYRGDDFGEKVSLFLTKHQSLKLGTIGPYAGCLSEGSTNGYFVYFEHKVPCPCDTIK